MEETGRLRIEEDALGSVEIPEVCAKLQTALQEKNRTSKDPRGSSDEDKETVGR